MKIIAINASPKRKGALSSLVSEAVRSAREHGAEAGEIRLADQDISYCTFCLTCYRDKGSGIGKCPQNDDMQWILPVLRAAEGYILGTEVSSGHVNAIMKTFIERCVFTAGSATGRTLWFHDTPTSRFTDRTRFAITIVTAGTIPAWPRVVCDTTTRQLKEMADLSFYADVIGTLYAGEQTFKGSQDRDIKKAHILGQRLVAKIGESGTSTTA